jgi:hypothetical protein
VNKLCTNNDSTNRYRYPNTWESGKEQTTMLWAMLFVCRDDSALLLAINQKCRHANFNKLASKRDRYAVGSDRWCRNYGQ